MNLDSATLDLMARRKWKPPIKSLPDHPTHEVLWHHHVNETRHLLDAIAELAMHLQHERSKPSFFEMIRSWLGGD